MIEALQGALDGFQTSVAAPAGICVAINGHFEEVSEVAAFEVMQPELGPTRRTKGSPRRLQRLLRIFLISFIFICLLISLCY